ncbi:Taurine-binding periplasmic protein TauA [plant metagenome]|uniref:Taurine-binding periplasmic protein TauA n=1 Tax=plant metagenome TaxID=1297885 RepID=A0A484SKE4_9ZZZZ
MSLASPLRTLLRATLPLILGLGATSASAEGTLRIAYQFDVGDIVLHVVRDQKLIEKHGKADGLDIAVDWRQLSGGSAINDAILSDSIDVASTGLPPLLTIWDRTRNRQRIKAIAALGSLPVYLLSRNPAVKSLDDLGPSDKIALPATTVSLHARLLQIAAAQKHGKAQFARYDAYTVSLPHGEATAALLSGKTEINNHFSSPPFWFKALKDPAIHKVTGSYDILGGPSTLNILWTTGTFHDENPRTVAALRKALEEGLQLVLRDKKRAAQIYASLEGSNLPVEEIEAIISHPDVRYTLQPQNTFKLAEFLHDVGAIKTRPTSWRDYFFESALVTEGS